MNTALRISLVVLFCTVAASCSASYPTEPTKARPVALYLAYGVPQGRTVPGPAGTDLTYTFFAYTVDADGVYERVSERVTWSSSDDGVVVAQGGLSSAGIRTFRAVAPGSANVIVRYEGLEATAPVLVVPNDVLSRTPRIECGWSGANTVGSVSFASVIHRPTNQSLQNIATWTSSDPTVATIGAGGRITAVGRGTTIITANVDGLIDWFWFSVLPNP